MLPLPLRSSGRSGQFSASTSDAAADPCRFPDRCLQVSRGFLLVRLVGIVIEVTDIEFLVPSVEPCKLRSIVFVLVFVKALASLAVLSSRSTI